MVSYHFEWQGRRPSLVTWIVVDVQGVETEISQSKLQLVRLVGDVRDSHFFDRRMFTR